MLWTCYNILKAQDADKEHEKNDQDRVKKDMQSICADMSYRVYCD